MKGLSKLLSEVRNNTYDTIVQSHSKDRLVMTKSPNLKYDIQKQKPQRVTFKPRGLWYGIGTSWIDWVRYEMPEWEGDYVYHIDVNESKMRIIRNHGELIQFEKEFRTFTESWQNDLMINWPLVAEQYSGIEIAPYIQSARMDHMWYYGWDVASGCIWRDDAIRNIIEL